MPDACRTSIEFVRGGRSEWLAPWEVEAWRLPFRFAVVQDTYRPDSVDMYFDRAMWLRLFDFARDFSAGNSPTIIDRPIGETDFTVSPSEKHEMSPEAYRTANLGAPDEDWRPPERVIVRERGEPVLVIATEYWANVGGPNLYHDSLTYSIFSREDLASRVMEFLADADAAVGWELASVAIPAPDPPPPSALEKFFSWLRRHA